MGESVAYVEVALQVGLKQTCRALGNTRAEHARV